MKKYILGALVATFAITLPVAAQYVGGGSVAGGGGGGGGGGGPASSIADGATLAGSSTTCADPLALAWGSDTDSGLQYLGTGAWQMCVDAARAGLVDGQSGTIGRGNTTFGHDSMINLDRNAVDGATHNAGIGAESCHLLTKGDQNSCLGHRALYSTTTGIQNTAVGQGALYENTTGSGSVGLGYHALLNNTNTTGANVCLGTESCEGGSGTANHTSTVAVGYQTLKPITTAPGNTAIGYMAGNAVSSGALNTLVGYQSGLLLNTGGANTCVGRETCKALTSHQYNVAVGAEAAKALIDTQNVMIGTIAGYAATSAAGNTIIGYGAAGAGTVLTTGDGNVCIGRNCDVGTANAQNRIIIGDAAQGSADNQVTIGNTSITQTRLRGHLASLSGGTPSGYTAGTCTNETGSGTDVRGSITADCTAGQTAVVTFGVTFGSAPTCVFSAANAAAAAAVGGAAGVHAATTTTTLTLTFDTAATAASVAYICME